MRARRTVALLFLAFATSLHAQEAARKRAITIDDYFTQADIGQVAVGRSYVAYTEARWQEATDDRKSDLWLVRPADQAVRRLTSERANDRAPQWDPAERYVYFLGNRKREAEKRPPYDGKTQVWRLPPTGGEPEAVTRVEGGVEAFELARDGTSLLYQVSHEKVEDDFAGLRSKFKSLDYGHGKEKRSQLWKLDLTTWRAEKLVDEGRYIHEFSAAPDGQRIAMITTPDDKVISFEGQSRVDLFDVHAGKATPLPDAVFRAKAPSPYGWLEKLAWSADSTSLAFNVIFDGYPAQIIVAQWRASEPSVFPLPLAAGMHVRGYGSPLQWRAVGRDLCFCGEEKGRVRLCMAREVQAGKRPEFDTLTGGDVVVEAFSRSHDAQQADHVAVVKATPTQLADVYFSSGASERRITHVNPQADSWQLPKLSVVSWQGAGGKTVEGILELPPDHIPGKPVPLVVEIHGGPTTASYYKLQYWIYGRTLLPARGYAVLCPNYRGSTGYGDTFTTDLIGRENDLDVEDILKGVDALVERGIADPQRLAVSGWSNGGYLTNCLITKTDRFKAAISGAGIVDTIMEFGANDEPAYAIVFKQGFPWSNPEKYHRASSTYQLDRIRTPTLIHVGANDERCPPGHSRMLYRTLKYYNHVPTELIVYPGEGHGVMAYKHRRAKMEWDLAWLERYVKGGSK